MVACENQCVNSGGLRLLLRPFGTGRDAGQNALSSRATGTPKHGRSTVTDTEAIQSPEDPCGFGRLLVPRGGIEPPTRGFSVPCSTD
jgi:hypothetical protein